MAIQTDVSNVSVPSSVLSNSPGSYQLFNGRFRLKQFLFVGNNSSTGYLTIYDAANQSSITGAAPPAGTRVVYQLSFHTSNVPTSVDIPEIGRAHV